MSGSRVSDIALSNGCRVAAPRKNARACAKVILEWKIIVFFKKLIWCPSVLCTRFTQEGEKLLEDTAWCLDTRATPAGPPLLTAALVPSNIWLEGHHQQEDGQQWEKVGPQVCTGEMKFQHLLWNKSPVEITTGKSSGQRRVWHTLNESSWAHGWRGLSPCWGRGHPQHPSEGLRSQTTAEFALLLSTSPKLTSILRCVQGMPTAIILPCFPYALWR